LRRKNHRRPPVTTKAPPAYLAPSARVQIPLKVLHQHAGAVVLGRTFAVSAVAAGQRGSARIASSWCSSRAARSQLVEAARRRAAASLPPISSHGADFGFVKASVSL